MSEEKTYAHSIKPTNISPLVPMVSYGNYWKRRIVVNMMKG